MPLPYSSYSDTFVADTNRVPSPTLWDRAPIDAVRLGAKNGMWYRDDFESALTGDTSTVTVVDQPNWDATVLTAGTGLTTAATSTNRGGILQLDAGNTTANNGIQIQQGLVASWILTATNNEVLYFETRVRPVANVTGDHAIGMFATDTTITDGSTITTGNQLGFTTLTGDGVLLFNANKAGTGTTQTATTMVADTFVKLGFVVYYAGASLVCDAFVNGLKLSTQVTTTNIPIVALRPSFVCQNSTTTRAKLDIDWVQVLHVYGQNT